MRRFLFLCYILTSCVLPLLGYSGQSTGVSRTFPSGFYEINCSEELDKQTQALLENIDPIPEFLLNTPISGIRELMPLQSLSNDIPPHPLLKSVKNIVINGPEGPFGLRIFEPKKEGVLPVLIYLHGGGWAFGSIDEYDGLCQDLCYQTECIVVSVDYHLAPEYPFPKPLNDCYAAAKWVSSHSVELGGDPEKIAIAGDSAGGNLAAAVTLMAREKKDLNLCYQVLICPATNCNFDTLSYYEFENGYFLTKRFMKFFWDKYLINVENGKNPLASPLKAENLSNLPPACIVIANFDPLRDDGLAYGLRLHREGVQTIIKRFNTIHGFYVRKELKVSEKAISFIVLQLRERFEKMAVSAK